METISSGFWTAIGRSNTALTKLKIAVFAPMPRASVSTATAVKPGFFIDWRKAKRRSFIAQRLHRIDLCRSSGGQPAGQQRNREQQQHDSGEHARLGWADIEQLMPDQPREPERGDNPQHGSDRDKTPALRYHHGEHVTASRAHGHADADFARAPRDRASKHRVGPPGLEQ